MWPTGYTIQAVTDALLAPQRRWSFRYDLLDLAYQPKGPLKVISASIEYNALATGSNRTAKFLVPSEEAARMDFYNDQIQAWALLRMPDGNDAEFPIGVFDITSNGATWINRRRMQNEVLISESMQDAVEIQGFDGLVRLQQASSVNRYEIAAGGVYTDNIRGLLTNVNLGAAAIEWNPTTLPVMLEWPPGTSYLTIANNLADGINYEQMHINPKGILECNAYKPPESASVLFTYKVDRKSVIIPGIDVAIDTFNIPNVFVSAVSEPDRAPLRSVYTNNNPNSVLSVQNRRRTIVQIIEPDQKTGEEEVTAAATQAMLDAKVLRAAQEASQVYETCEFTTGLMPIHDYADVCMIDYGRGPLRYRETGWSMELKAGGQMKHSMRRVVIL